MIVDTILWLKDVTYFEPDDVRTMCLIPVPSIAWYFQTFAKFSHIQLLRSDCEHRRSLYDL